MTVSPPLPPRKLDDWLTSYAKVVANSESPQVFHIWVALATIAGAAQRKIMMKAAYYDVHTNMYVILVSPPGRGKKTTAMRVGKNILKLVEPKVNFATQSGSPEALVGIMAKISNPDHQSLTLFSSELGTLMMTNAASMVDLLTDIYDGNPDWDRQTVAHSYQEIKRPWLNLITGTTPNWLGENLPPTAVEGGFLARSIVAWSDELLLEEPFPELTPDQIALHKDLVHDLSRIAQISGIFTFAGGKQGEAYQFYDKWYRDKSRFPKNADPRLATYFDRKHIHILKVAMALSLSYKDELVLELVDLQRALALLDATEKGMEKAFGGIGRNDYSTDYDRVYMQIASQGRVPYGALIAANYHNIGKRKLDEILDELRIMGRINVDGRIWFVAKPESPTPT